MIRRFIGALAPLTVFASIPAFAQTTSSLQLKDASGAIQTESITTYNGAFFVNHMTWGWNVSLTKPLAWTMDANGNGGVDANCQVVSADQSLVAGGYAPCTLTTTGRLKVGLSSAGLNGATGSTTSDEMGALDPGGLEQALVLDALHNLKIDIAGGYGSSSTNPLFISGTFGSALPAGSNNIGSVTGEIDQARSDTPLPANGGWNSGATLPPSGVSYYGCRAYEYGATGTNTLIIYESLGGGPGVNVASAPISSGSPAADLSVHIRSTSDTYSCVVSIGSSGATTFQSAASFTAN